MKVLKWKKVWRDFLFLFFFFLKGARIAASVPSSGGSGGASSQVGRGTLCKFSMKRTIKLSRAGSVRFRRNFNARVAIKYAYTRAVLPPTKSRRLYLIPSASVTL